MQPKVLIYRNYKFFNNENFKNDLCGIQQLGFQNIRCKQFEHLIMKILKHHASQIKRLSRANNSPFISKELYKAIMMRSR